VFTDEKQFTILRPRNSQNDRQIIANRSKAGYLIRPRVMKAKSVMVSFSELIGSLIESFRWRPQCVLTGRLRWCSSRRR
jgi:hypothetical protein